MIDVTNTNSQAFRLVGEIIEELSTGLKNGSICPCIYAHDSERGDSILERAFWKGMYTSAQGHHGTIDQFYIGKYRVDAAIDCDGQTVVIELDGKSFHDLQKDKERDLYISQHVDAIIRIPYVAMWYYPEATFDLLASWYPRFKRPRHYDSISLNQFQSDYNDASEKDEADEFLDSSDACQIWSRELSAVGSMKQFLYTGNFRRISHVRTLKGNAETLDRLWSSSKCNRGAASVRDTF